ncbi:MAG: hypothetical protein KGJ57_17600 [Sphingomonadales bacterium]|nr:hypothetical protein [Sphingomonadales bacterium]MDE2171214.1 hypothetical protein [Sphingomonadales bacterium]
MSIDAAAMTCQHCGAKLYETGEATAAAAPSPAKPPSGRVSYWVGIALIAVSMLLFAGEHVGIADTIIWLGLFLAGVINLGVSSIVRAITGQKL